MSGTNDPGPPAGPRPRVLTPAPHDALARALLSDPGRLRAVLRDHLPNDISGLLADTPPRVVDGSFVDEALRGTQSDLLAEVETADGRPAFVYALIENKARPDAGTALQLAGYMVRIWQRHAGGCAERLRNLPPVIPLVLYTGTARWTVPEGLAEMFGGADPALVHLPGERFILRALAGMDPDRLSGDEVVRAGFMTLTRRGLGELRRTAAALEGSPALQEQVIGYILRTYQDVDIDTLGAALGEAGASRMEEIMGTVAETLRAEGRAEGKAEGRAEFLVHLLESRFGPLPRDLRSRIAGAEPTQLDGWFDRGLGAGSLDAVFGDG